MSTTIGANLRLDGEKEFKAALKESNDSLKVLGSELKLVAAEYDKNDKSVEALTAQQDVLSRTVAEQKDKVKLLEDRLKEAANAFGEADSRTKALQVQLNNANAEMVKTQKELDSVTADLKAAEKGEDDAGDAAEKAGKQAKEGGSKAEKSGEGWDKLAVAAGAAGAALAAAAAAVGAGFVAAGKALTDFAVEGAGYADDILTLSSVTGMSTQKLQELQYAAELVDTSVETISGSMTKNLASMVKAQEGNDKLADAYNQLGVSIVDANGNLRDDETVYWELIDALGQVEDETERDALAMSVLGKSAKDLNPLIEAGADTMKALGVQAHNAGAVLDEDTLDAFAEFDDQMAKLESGVGAAKNALGTILLPVLSELAGDGVHLLGEFTQGILDADGDVSKMGDVVAEVFPKVLDIILEYVPDLITLAGTLITSLADALAADDNLSKIMDAATTLFTQLLQSVLNLLPELIPVAVETVLTLATALLAPDNIKLIIESGVQLLLTLIQGLADTLPELVPLAVNAIVTLVDTLTDPANLGMLVTAAIDIILALSGGLIDALPDLLLKAPEIVANLATAIVEAAPQLLNAALQLILKLAEGLASFFYKVKEKGREIADSVKDGFSEKVEAAKTWGKDLIQNFVDGLLAKWEELKSGVRGVAQTVKDFLGFSEPKEGPLSDFHEYAPDMIDLFVKGLRDNTRRLRAQLADTFALEDPTVSIPEYSIRRAGIVSELDIRGGAQTVSLDAASLAALQGARGAGETVVTINFTGSLAQLGRLLQPEIATATRLRGPSMVN